MNTRGSVRAASCYDAALERFLVTEYCVVFVDSDGWSFKDMEPLFDDLDSAKREAQDRQKSTGLPALGVADRHGQQLVWRTDGGDTDIPMKFDATPVD